MFLDRELLEFVIASQRMEGDLTCRKMAKGHKQTSGIKFLSLKNESQL
jgi:hypothetical protein